MPQQTTATPHPDFLDQLFLHRSKIRGVFKDVLGLYNIDHIALSHIDGEHRLLTLSSTPSLEFNLFNGPLWRYDKTYHSSWYLACTPSSWESLYLSEHYDALYDVKQKKHQYALGISLPIKRGYSYVIYSMATQTKNDDTQETFKHNHTLFNKIGDYCSHHLLPLFEDHLSWKKH